jgi:hypothetical protein
LTSAAAGLMSAAWAMPKAAAITSAKICLVILNLLIDLFGGLSGFAKVRCLVSNNAGIDCPDVIRKVTRGNAV